MADVKELKEKLFSDTRNGLKKATEEQIKEAYAFCDLLVKGGLSATVRRSFGGDIEGACGQLRRSYIEKALPQ